jgi:hypothetical protein
MSGGKAARLLSILFKPATKFELWAREREKVCVG